MTRPILLFALAAHALAAQAQTSERPPVGEAVATFAEARMGQQVGRGECWDLAQYALDHAHARWDGRYGFGDKVGKTDVQRGDIVQFDKVLIERRTGRSVEQVNMGPHTGIVLEVEAPGRFVMAHQNFGPEGRTVSRYELALDQVKRGRITFYRPAR